MQQVKEQGKNRQTKQVRRERKNPENKMEAHIGKLQEMFNKDLQELKNKQSTINNAITEVKNIQERNIRVTETEEQICELEDRMVAITEAEHNKEKKRRIN